MTTTNIRVAMCGYDSILAERAFVLTTYEIASYISHMWNVAFADRLSDEQSDDLFNAMSVFARFGNHTANQEVVTMGFGTPDSFERLAFNVVCGNQRNVDVDTLSFDMNEFTWALNIVGEVAPGDGMLNSGFRRHIGEMAANIRELIVLLGMN